MRKISFDKDYEKLLELRHKQKELEVEILNIELRKKTIKWYKSLDWWKVIAPLIIAIIAYVIIYQTGYFEKQVLQNKVFKYENEIIKSKDSLHKYRNSIQSYISLKDSVNTELDSMHTELESITNVLNIKQQDLKSAGSKYKDLSDLYTKTNRELKLLKRDYNKLSAEYRLYVESDLRKRRIEKGSAIIIPNDTKESRMPNSVRD